ncbi:MAG TPA: 16S rRNA (cytosine(967)-C(5))-methyltransferase RsmB [Chromatiales bacterium]|nr:16S rRNA (cytosine(967)-C(5))-methyltransferase RsmB [Thiotrichales bacterium]HIP67262.1 16S rRNA (cytosine(967)-C(5))-methyltransferase RsmB [Chromatiales bacterium]
MKPRLAAATVVQRVIAGESLARALPAELEKQEKENRATIQALSYGVLRQYERLQFLSGKLLRKPLKSRDAIITTLLQVGLFELLDGQTPEHAVVSETVSLVRKQRAWAAGLVNACLRRFIREREALLRASEADLSAHYCLPSWLLVRLQDAWPEDWRQIALASSSPAPMTLRVNRSQVSRDEYRQQLADAGLHAKPHAQVETALVLDQAVDVTSLPGFETGRVSVQDAAAQLAALLLDLQPGQRVLDACAAPGGKTLHLLDEVSGKIDLVAIEKDPQRIDRLKENLLRGRYQVDLKIADAGDLNSWWDGQGFDRILLDAPCSATGVIRRHPDIKLHRRPDDIAQLQAQQKRLLYELWQTLKPGGLLLYATCSILPEENRNQVELFLQEMDDAQEIMINAEWGRPVSPGRQIFPGENNMDGFFYACLKKSA